MISGLPPMTATGDKSMFIERSHPQICSLCLHRVGKVQQGTSEGESYCTVHKMSCYSHLGDCSECEDFHSTVPISKPKEPKFAKTDASLDRFFTTQEEKV